jgi:hypothetical protein
MPAEPKATSFVLVKYPTRARLLLVCRGMHIMARLPVSRLFLRGPVISKSATRADLVGA